MPRLDEELEGLRGTPEDLVRAEVRIAYGGGVPPCLRRAMSQPRKFLTQLANLIEQFWQEAIAPHWAFLQARLEGEMLYRARTLAVGGVNELFAGLHKDVTLQDGRLVVRSVCHWDGGKRNSGLLLVPSVFAWPDVFLTVRPPWRTAIMYPSRGIADLWEHTSSSCSNGLQLLVGPSCAKVISNLQVPRTTLEMSAAVGLSPAATSEQITKLRDVGILERTRVGRRVFYSLNQRGMALLTSFSA
jgi:DNA-binding transcriptional ArsR family regulator